MTITQALNRAYEEIYNEHAPSSNLSAIAAINDILKQIDEEPVTDLGDGIYKALLHFANGGGGSTDAVVGTAIVGTSTVAA